MAGSQDGMGVEGMLDNPVWHALSGPHERFAQVRGSARRYLPELTPFGAVADPESNDLTDFVTLVPEGGVGALVAPLPATAPPGLRIQSRLVLTQMICRTARPPLEREVDLVDLGEADVPEMLELVELTRPGPFGRRTIEMGRYVGVREGGRLVGMAGERMRVPGGTEVSAVCVHPEARGRGLARVLVAVVTRGIVERGEMPFLHVFPDNMPAIATYEAVGFEARQQLHVTLFERAG